MRLTTARAIQSWSSFPESRTLDDADFVEWGGGVPASTMLVFVSHRWITPGHPDPEGRQLRELQQRLQVLADLDEGFDEALVFYDYCSMLQRPRTPDEEAEFVRDLDALRELLAQANKVIILSEGYADYKHRGWCFFEFVTASPRTIHRFPDQQHMEEDLGFVSGLMGEPEDLGVLGFVTSEKLSYKVNFPEAEVVILAFQHLDSCRTTHAEDRPTLRTQLARHFNSRETTSFGRLMTAIAKFFDVELVLVATGGPRSGPTSAEPFLGQPGWRRLPVPNMGSPSKFAVPETDAERLLTHGYMPMLRLTRPGVEDYGAFLQEFSKAEDWHDYVVPAPKVADLLGSDGQERDCFPSLDHVVHTVLERPPGFMVGPGCLFLPLSRDLEDHLIRRR